MREFTITKNEAGQRLDRWLAKTLPVLPAALAQKYLRLKRVKLNGRGAKRDVRLVQGDVLQLYINDEFFEIPSEENAFLSVSTPQLDVIYEDDNILLIDKRPGMVVHPDETERVNTLVSHMQAYLYQKREWTPNEQGSFTPALCNRIDRNTGGIVIAAKNAEALRVINEKIREQELEKSYLCIACGEMKWQSGRLENFLLKDEQKNQVAVYHKPVPGGRKAITDYRRLAQGGGLSLLECRLLTGRTHQIRAQLADLGHPLLGDGKYGSERVNRQFGRKYQALYSYKLRFSFRSDAGALAYLDGQEFIVSKVDFVQEYFPSLSLEKI